MGCSLCRGHAHQVCGAPGCHDETKEVEEYMRNNQVASAAVPYGYPATTDATWHKLDNVILCSYCHMEPALWRNARNEYRCVRCPKF